VHIALFAATIFLLHPIQTSAVNYITQRMAIMAAMFSFAGIILYVKGASLTGKNSLGAYALSAVCFVLAIFSKENAVMVIPALMLYDYFFLSSFRWGPFRKRFVPIMVILTSLAVMVMFYLHGVSIILKIMTIFSNPYQPMASYGWSGTHMHWTPVEHILTELRVLVRYLFLVFVPLPSYMVFDYSNAYPVSKDLFHPITTLFSFLFLVTVVSLAIRYRKKMPLIAFGIIWYLVTISLESFIGVGLDPYFEYRNYLPGYGLFLATASLFLYKEKFNVGVRKEAIILLVALLLFAMTFTRNGIWSEGRLFWEDTVEKSPNNVRARVNLGVIYAEEGLTGRAIEQYQIALGLMPDSSAALENLGIAYAKKGWFDKAIEEYRAALKLQPKNFSVHYNMGHAYFEKGEVDKAIEEYQTALAINPKMAKAHINLGIAYGSKGLMDKAIEHFLTAIEFDPELVEAHYNLGIAFAKAGSVDRAIEQFQIVVEVQPDYKNARNNLRYLQGRNGGN
jgi:protein O-mannosyl-transferase